MQDVKVGRQLIEIVTTCYRANRPLLLIGNHGVGKSELIEQAAQALDIGCVVRDLSLMEPPDLVGLPQADNGRTRYLPPTFLPSDGNGLLVFEELNRCERYMRAPCLQLLTSRCLNDYCLPVGWLPVAAINPPDEDYEVHELDPAILSRFVQIRLVPDRDYWLEWARNSDVHPAVVAYATADKTIFDSPESNPRAWKYVSDAMYAFDEASASNEALRAVVLGLVGDMRGTAFIKTLSTANKPLTAEQVLGSYSKLRPCFNRWVASGRIDLVKATMHSVKVRLQSQVIYREAISKRKPKKNLADFVTDLPGDLRKELEEFFANRKYPALFNSTRRKRYVG